jgi:hypothetical protein
VNASVRLIANLAIDAGAVRDHFAICERGRELIDVVETTLYDRIADTAPPDTNHFMSFTNQTSC